MLELTLATVFVLASAPGRKALSPRVLDWLMFVPAVAALALAWFVYFSYDSIALSASGPAMPIWAGESKESAATVGCYIASSLAAGSWLGRRLLPAGNATRPKASISSARTAFVVAALADMVFVWAYGAGNLLYRTEYLSTYDVPSLAPVSVLLVLFAWTLGSYARNIYGSCQARLEEGLVAIFQLLVATELFSTASRFLAVVPIISLVMHVVLSSRMRAWQLGATLLASVLAATLALSDRASVVGHGLLPYLGRLQEAVFAPNDAFAALSSIAFSLPLAAFVGSYGAVSANDLFVSLSPPLLSEQAWSVVAPSLRVHEFIPFNAFGELLSFSPLSLLAYCCAMQVGIYLALRLANANPSGPLAALAVAMLLLVFILSLEYNLRSASRPLYFVGVAIVVLGGRRMIAMATASRSARAPAFESLPRA